jgi:hypothetical protein
VASSQEDSPDMLEHSRSKHADGLVLLLSAYITKRSRQSMVIPEPEVALHLLPSVARTYLLHTQPIIARSLRRR